MSTFTTKPIDALPAATALQDGSMIPICQDGTAKKLTGAAFKTFAANAGKEQAAAELGRMLVEVVQLEEGAAPTVTKEIDETTGAIRLIFGIPAGSGSGVQVVPVTSYVVGTPVEFVLSKDSWDGTNYTLKAVGYKIGDNEVQLGLPADDDTTNTQRVVQAALTIPNAVITNPDTSNNIAGYTTLTISAVNRPSEDILIAVFGLEEVDTKVVVTQAAIEGVTVPVTGEKRMTSIDNEQYTGTIAWNPDNSTFAASTVYTATITLVAKPGYTLTGVASNFFTVAGATSVTNSANSGVVTAKFPATAAEATT